MSKKKRTETITVHTDLVKVARKMSRESIGAVRGSIAHASLKDYNRNSKQAKRERDRIRKGEYE